MFAASTGYGTTLRENDRRTSKKLLHDVSAIPRDQANLPTSVSSQLVDQISSSKIYAEGYVTREVLNPGFISVLLVTRRYL